MIRWDGPQTSPPMKIVLQAPVVADDGYDQKMRALRSTPAGRLALAVWNELNKQVVPFPPSESHVEALLKPLIEKWHECFQLTPTLPGLHTFTPAQLEDVKIMKRLHDTGLINVIVVWENRIGWLCQVHVSSQVRNEF